MDSYAGRPTLNPLDKYMLERAQQIAPTGKGKTINCYHAPLKASMRFYWSMGV